MEIWWQRDKAEEFQSISGIVYWQNAKKTQGHSRTGVSKLFGKRAIFGGVKMCEGSSNHPAFFQLLK